MQDATLEGEHGTITPDNNGDSENFLLLVDSAFFGFRFNFLFDFFLKFQISIGQGWGTASERRSAPTGRNGGRPRRCPSPGQLKFEILKLRIDSSEMVRKQSETIRKRSENDPKTVRNGLKTIRHRPKLSENDPKPSETIRNGPKTVRN